MPPIHFPSIRHFHPALPHLLQSTFHFSIRPSYYWKKQVNAGSYFAEQLQTSDPIPFPTLEGGGYACASEWGANKGITSCFSQGNLRLLYYRSEMYIANPLQTKNNQQILIKIVPTPPNALTFPQNSSPTAKHPKSIHVLSHSCETSPQFDAKTTEVPNFSNFPEEVGNGGSGWLKPVGSGEESRAAGSRLNAQKQKFSKIKARQLELKKKAESILSNSSSNSSPLKCKSAASQDHRLLLHTPALTAHTPSPLSNPPSPLSNPPSPPSNPPSPPRKDEKARKTIRVEQGGQEQCFEVIRFVDEGCFGKVYLVQHEASRLVFCLKAIDRTFLDETNLAQLVREIKIQSVADHPNIVHLYAFFVDENYVYLLLEPCLGGNLFRAMARAPTNSLPERDARKYIKEVAKAVDYLHKLNVIHRDIKPENVLLHENSAKLCDFGWAVHSPLMRETQCGTPLYASPEVIRSEQYDSKIDIWCLGVLTYELLYGEPPFKIRTINDMVKIVDEEVYYPQQLHVSWPAVEFMRGCLQKKAPRRFEIRQVLDHEFLLHTATDRFRNTIV